MGVIVEPWRRLGALPFPVWATCVTALINRAGTMALPFLTDERVDDAGPSLGATVLQYFGARALWVGCWLVEGVSVGLLAALPVPRSREDQDSFSPRPSSTATA